MQQTIAIVSGTGAEGFGLAARFARAGARVVVGSRDLQRAQDAARRIGVEGRLNVDAVSEAEVRQALDRLSAGRTTIVIAHRLSTIRGADHIVVLDDGSVVEQGRHGDLVALDGLYSHLIASQMRARSSPVTQPVR